MTWSHFSKIFGNPIDKYYNQKSLVIQHPNILPEYIKPFTEDIYREYDYYFQNKDDKLNITCAQMDLPIWFSRNWILYDDSIKKVDRLDFHGLNRAETQYWLEYLEKNQDRFSKIIHIITGRGNHATQTYRRDISIKIMSKNDSTGVLEDFVYRWLKQHHYRFVKHPGSYDVYL